MYNLALVGKNISHSRSQEVYEKLLNQKINYSKYDIEEERLLPSLEDIFTHNTGLSITTPYKDSYLGVVKLDDKCPKLGAINCIKKNTSGEFIATNTDYLALDKLLDEALAAFSATPEVYLLGRGHMAELTSRLLVQKNISFFQLHRGMGFQIETYNFNQAFSGHQQLIINACSRNFVFVGELPKQSVFWDYNYSFPEHEVRLPSKCHYWDGYQLLYRQAEYALKFWKIPTK